MPRLGLLLIGVDERQHRSGAQVAFRLFENAGSGGGGSGDDRQIDGLADVGNRSPAAPAEDRAVLGIHRVERAVEATGDQVLQDRPSKRAGTLRRADERHRARGEQGGEGVAHGAW